MEPDEQSVADASAQGRSQSVRRIVDILRALATTAGPVAVRDLAARAGAPKTTVHRVLLELQELGVVDSTGGGGYMLSLDTFNTAAQLVGRADHGQVIRAELTELSKKTNEAAYLGMRLGNGPTMAFTVGVPGGHPLRYNVPIGEPAPLYKGASGKAILAWADQTSIRTILEDAVSAGDIADVKVGNDELARIRSQGFVVTYGEKVEGAVGIAAPIFAIRDGVETVVGDAVVTVPDTRSNPERERLIATHVVETAERISTFLRSVSHDVQS